MSVHLRVVGSYRQNLPSAENYVDPDFMRIGTRVTCYGDVAAFQGNWDANMWATGSIDVSRPWRSQERAMASYKYIQTLLTGKPY
jgi:hypothetical protein